MGSDVDIARLASAVLSVHQVTFFCLYVCDAQQARHLRGHPTCLVPYSGHKMGIVMHSGDVPFLLSLRLCRYILDVSSVLDDVKVVVDEEFSVFNVTQDPEHASSTRTYESTSS